MIGWGHIIRGRISKAFFPQIKQYYYQNKLGKIFRPQFWFKRLTTFTLTLHDEEWTQHCAKIHQPTKDKKNYLKTGAHRPCTQMYQTIISSPKKQTNMVWQTSVVH